MDRKEIEELEVLGRALNDIDRRFPDLEGITLKQLSELTEMHHLTTTEIMALLSLVRWGRMYKRLSELGGSQREGDGVIQGFNMIIPDEEVQERRHDPYDSRDERRARHNIEFL